MNIRDKNTTINTLLTLEQHHLNRAKEVRSVIDELKARAGTLTTGHYDSGMSLPQKILFVLGEAEVFMEVRDIAETIAFRDGIDDLTQMRADVSKRLNKLKTSGKLVNIKEEGQKHGVKWGLASWG